MKNFVVRTQTLENYGAHSEDGRFSSGNAYWKAKGGNDYLVQGLNRFEDAWAFVMTAFSENNIYCKEFPVECITEEEWIEQLPDDPGYRDFLKKELIVVSPGTGEKYFDF